MPLEIPKIAEVGQELELKLQQALITTFNNNKETFLAYEEENIEDGQPGLLSTMVILNSYFGKDLAGLRVVDYGCGLNAPIDRILIKEKVNLLGVDQAPGSYEKFLYEKFGHNKRPEANQEAKFDVYRSVADFPLNVEPVDAVISIRLFGFPLLKRNGTSPNYEEARGEEYVQWLNHFDKSESKQNFIKQLKEIASVVKVGGLVVIVFQPTPDITTKHEGEIWSELLVDDDLSECGFKIIKDRKSGRKMDDYSGPSAIKKASHELGVGYRETIILKRVAK